MREAIGPGLDIFPPDLREQFTGEMARTLANRQNAKKSTGPKTEKGKATSSKNRLAHGLCSTSLIVGGETEADFEALLASVKKAYKPVNDEEAMLTDQLTQALWRFNRAQRVETQVFQFSQLNRLVSSNRNNQTEHEFDQLTPSQGDNMFALAFCSDFDYKQMERITRYITTMERSYLRALNALRHSQEKLASNRKIKRRTAGRVVLSATPAVDPHGETGSPEVSIRREGRTPNLASNRKINGRTAGRIVGSTTPAVASNRKTGSPEMSIRREGKLASNRKSISA